MANLRRSRTGAGGRLFRRHDLRSYLFPDDTGMGGRHQLRAMEAAVRSCGFMEREDVERGKEVI